MENESLSSFVESICGDSHLRVEADFGDGFVRLKSSEAERRQAAQDIQSSEDIIIEMLRNARDANARNIFLATSRENDTRRIVMIDDGDGMPEAMFERVFEPRVTSKLETAHMDKWGMHGRGMALYSIKVNATCAKVVASQLQGGSAFLVETSIKTLGEKADQSTFPTFEVQESGAFAMRGPKNLLRTACEFALESRQVCSVYFGSPTDIAATLWEYGGAALSPAQRIFCDNIRQLPLCKRLAACGDAELFAEQAALLGLQLSPRSAQRIMAGTIEPLPTLTERLQDEAFPRENSRSRGNKRKQPGATSRKLRLTDEDILLLKETVGKAYADIAHRYYLSDNSVPDVRVSGDTLRISIPLEKLD